MKLMLVLTAAALVAGPLTAATQRCHDAKGKFIKCPPASSAPVAAAMVQGGITKDKNGKCHVASGPAKGRFTACPK